MLTSDHPPRHHAIQKIDRERGDVLFYGCDARTTQDPLSRIKCCSIERSFTICQSAHPFTIDAFVLLPDHLHCIWTLPENDSSFSMRWRQIKSYFSRQCLDELKGHQTAAHLQKGEQAIWQRRFWEHQLRDDGDFIRHVEYIHYNPVKHGLTKSPELWPHSTFHSYVDRGIYHVGWGADHEIVFEQNVGNE